MPTAKLEVGNTLEAIRTEFLRRSGLIFRVTLVFSLLSGLSTLIRFADPVGFAVGMGFTILFSAIFGGLMTVLICVEREANGIGDLWPNVRPVLARLIWLTLFVTVAIILALFAFIIPAIILGTFWAVAGQALLVERRGVFESVGRSFDLVRGSAWQVFAVLAVLGLLGGILLLLVLLVMGPFGTGPVASAAGNALSSLVTTPIFAVGTAVLYNQLVELKQPLVVEESGDPAATEEPGLPPEPRE